MSALICGSFAYDSIMVFPDRFKNHILPDKVHMLNVCFVVPSMRREFGGCAGNIGYSLKLLGGDVKLMGTVGQDFGPYKEWLDRNGMDSSYIRVIEDEFTAQAMITTDLDDNQITAFHVGAMSQSHLNRVSDAEGVTIGIVAPDGREGMLQHVAQFAEANIPCIFDPGQNVPIIEREALLQAFAHARWLTFNDYEWQLVQQKTGLTTDSVTDIVDALIVTRGADGSLIYTRGEVHEIPAVKAEQVVDPTGCGDAYRAGLLYGLMAEVDWETTGRIASLCGAIKVASHGTQNHYFEIQEFEDRFRQSFGYTFR